MIYQAQPSHEPLSQGDLLDTCPIVGLPDSYPEAKPEIWTERVIVLSQACDLAQSKVGKVVVALVKAATLMVEQGLLKSATIRDQIRRGQVHGWYFLPAAPAPFHFPSRSSIYATFIRSLARPSNRS